MREKIVALFFHVISWAVWAACIAAIFFGFSLLFTGAVKAPDVALRDARAVPTAASDLPAGEDPEAWRALELDLTLRSDKLSPYSLEIEKLTLLNAADLGFGTDSFVLLPEPLNFSREKPQETTVKVYLHADVPDRTDETAAEKLTFGVFSAHSRFGVVRLKIKDGKLFFTPVREDA